MIPFQHPSQTARTTPCHPCGTVQICDLGNSSHAKARSRSARCTGYYYLIRQAGACHLSCFASVSLIIVVQLRLSLVGLCDSARFRFAVSATGGAHLRAQGGRQRKRAEGRNFQAVSSCAGKLRSRSCPKTASAGKTHPPIVIRPHVRWGGTIP